ncbi:MAG: type II toxin-antitoxin system VapC family toxin [Candidatus Njordarchaeia archaeon]
MKDEVRYLLDASAFFNILPFIPSKKMEDNPDLELFITNLTPFEINNVIWKLYVRNSIGESEAKELSKLVGELIDSDAVKTLQIYEYEEILNMAIRKKMNYYDASYLYVAIREKLVLVTDDNGMKKHAETEGIKVINSDSLKSIHPNLFR